ncbi:lysosomal alpha-mannosidase-like [Belonocnema kinseyi]|uniref:lysosomal alpha-mannosidase-like n=1 Tax=Belonocnema kinseyi TaxID=2817044 RepID=UPI00143D86B6|nr:lysosomal alpha-mannosidase-like [Belonocnema kinseyi]XP_033226477.1 lysosomal alpha-mannosidase-like [Belonocnema kinseyi]
MWSSIFLLHLSVVILSVTTNEYHTPDNNKESTTCGYKACAKIDPKKLNIHIVPHTHDDVGWLQTFDQYYYENQDELNHGGVQYILNSVIRSLQESPERRFIYVESAFFFKWWDQQNEKVKTIVRSLIDEGRLEIIGGGWSMNDEAVTHYQSVIDQFSWGFRRLNDTFGQCARPKIGWQIDPFGHSREQASMFAQMGFDGLLFARIDYQDRGRRYGSKTAEFIWRGSPSLGENANIFTSVLFNQYSAPDGFCFDVTCTDEALIDDPDSPGYNIDRKVEEFLSYVQSQASSYRTNNILITMGNDFAYKNADMWYTNLDKLNKYINLLNGTDYNAIYSTPSCYIKALNEEKLAWSSKSDDFFPYGSEWNAYWTGYYTSRPTIKFYERMGNNFLQVVKQLSVVSNEPDNLALVKFREAMGVLQHHDAITGTEKEVVAHDYARILSKSINDGEKISSHTLRKMLQNGKKSEKTESLEFYSCPLLNISSCQHTEVNKNFVVTVYNPTSQPLRTFVRLPVTGKSYQVLDYIGNEVVTQIVPIPTTIQKIPGRQTSASDELVFLATGIPPLGYLSYYVRKNDHRKRVMVNDSIENPNTHASNKAFSISVDTTGEVIIESKIEKGVKLTQSIYYYAGVVSEYPGKWMAGNNGRASGAYIFRPNVTTGIRGFPYDGNAALIRGPLVEELHLTINEWISQVVRVYDGEERIEFSWLVGPIDINDGIGKEIITKYTTDLQSNGEFLTDSNGREMLKRKRNERPTWNLDLDEPVAGNYYPVTTKISISDEERKLKMAVLTDRAQGGSSLRDGEIELMVHRRLLCDDNFGVNEALNETAYGIGLVARGEHSVLIGSQSDSFVLQEKNKAISLSLRPWIFITPLETTSYDDWKTNYRMHSSGLAERLPSNIHILTLEPWKDGSVLLRLEHLFEEGESIEYSKPAKINLQDLFSDFIVTGVHETTLGGNQWLEDMERLKWVPDKDYVVGNNYTVNPINSKIRNEMEVLLMPKQIRTFVVNVSPRVSNTDPRYM